MDEPNLDQWTSIFALMAFLGLFLAPLLLWQAGQRRHQIRYIVAILVLFSIVLIYYVLYWSRYLQFVPFLSMLAELLFFLFGVLFYFYLKELLQQPISPRVRLFHFIPFILASGIHALLMFLKYTQPDTLFQTIPLVYYPYFYKALPWFVLIHLSIYAIVIIKLQPLFQSLREVARWARWFSLCYLGFVGANWSYYLLVQLPFFNRAWDYAISFSMASFIGLVGVLAYVQPDIFQTNQFSLFETQPAEKPEIRYQHSGLSTHLAYQFAQQLQQIMLCEQLYQDNELRLDTLAERLNISRHHLSQILNEQLGMNFFEYVNSLRIEEAKKLLSQEAFLHLNIIQIAYQAGFNNKVSFNKAFKNATGCTPKEFRQKMLNHSNSGHSEPYSEI